MMSLDDLFEELLSPHYSRIRKFISETILHGLTENVLQQCEQSFGKRLPEKEREELIEKIKKGSSKDDESN